MVPQGSGGVREKTGAVWQKIMQRCGCGTLEQFREVAPEKLFEAWQSAKKEVKGGSMATFPVEDGEFFVKGSRPKDIPYMAGSTSHDMAPPILQSMTKKWIAAREKPSYTWFFDRNLPGDKCGAWYSSDLWYWFGTLENCWRPMEQKDFELSGQMTDYLTNFCKTGNPNKTGALPTWIASDTDQKRVLRLGEGETRMGKPSLPKMIWTMLTNKAVGE